MGERQGWVLRSPTHQEASSQLPEEGKRRRQQEGVVPVLLSPLFLILPLRDVVLTLLGESTYCDIRTLRSLVRGNAFSQYVELQVDSSFSSHAKDRR